MNVIDIMRWKSLFLSCLPDVLLDAYVSARRFRRQTRDFGLHAVILHHWQRLQVFCVLFVSSID